MDLISGAYHTISKLLGCTGLKIQLCSASGSSFLTWKINDFRESNLPKKGHLQSPSFIHCDAEWALKLVTSDDGKSIDICVSRVSSKVNCHNVFVQVAFKSEMSDVDSHKKSFEVRDNIWNKITTIKRGNLDIRVTTCSNSILTFSCLLKASHTSQTPAKDPVKNLRAENDIPINSNWADVLSGDFEALLNNQRKCDVVLQVGKEKFLAHKLILGARSPVFAALLKQNVLQDGLVVVNVSDVPPSAVRDLLHYIYTGRIPTLTVDKAVELYAAASLYDLTELMEKCVKIMSAGLTLKNVCQLATVADKYDEAKMMDSIINFARNNRSDVLSSKEWGDLLKNEPSVASEIMKSVAADESLRIRESGMFIKLKNKSTHFHRY